MMGEQLINESSRCDNAVTTFLLETREGRVRHDFIRAVREAARFRNWYNQTDEYAIEHCETPPSDPGDRIPVGSTPFVLEILETVAGQIPTPRNVPDRLMDPEWSGRTIQVGTHKDVTDERFIKDTESFDGPAYIASDPPPGTYQISTVVDMDVEYRVFVHNQDRVGLRPYRGDFWEHPPDIDRIDRMIDRLENPPPAYTLDVYVNESGTYALEMHDFFACGLYGWSDPMVLPVMITDWYRWFCRTD